MILLDEIEKAHPDVFNILLQLMDDGRLTDGQGRTVDFTNTVVIMTQQPRRRWRRGAGDGRGARPLQARVPQPGRRDRRVPPACRRPTSSASSTSRSSSSPTGSRRAGCGSSSPTRRGKWIAKTGYDPDFGARPLKRVLQREVADPIALDLLKGDVPDGDTIVVDAKPDGGLVFDSAATAEIVT